MLPGDKLDVRGWLHASDYILDWLIEKQIDEMKNENAAAVAELEKDIHAVAEAMRVVLKEL